MRGGDAEENEKHIPTLIFGTVGGLAPRPRPAACPISTG